MVLVVLRCESHYLTHFNQCSISIAPENVRKTRFSDALRGCRNGTLGKIELCSKKREWGFQAPQSKKKGQDIQI